MLPQWLYCAGSGVLPHRWYGCRTSVNGLIDGWVALAQCGDGLRNTVDRHRHGLSLSSSARIQLIRARVLSKPDIRYPGMPRIPPSRPWYPVRVSADAISETTSGCKALMRWRLEDSCLPLDWVAGDRVGIRQSLPANVPIDSRPSHGHPQDFGPIAVQGASGQRPAFPLQYSTGSNSRTCQSRGARCTALILSNQSSGGPFSLHIVATCSRTLGSNSTCSRMCRYSISVPPQARRRNMAWFVF